jgi:hypothetical protein
MKRRRFPFQAGTQVVHRSLDEPSGVPKHGRVAETVGDALVIAQFVDETNPVGYDKRELTPLIMIPFLSSGPLMLTPRHLWNVLKHNVLALTHRVTALGRRSAQAASPAPKVS